MHIQPGTPAPDFDLPGVDGKNHRLKDFAGSKLLLVVFTCNHCPTAQAYESRLMQLHADYQDRGVALVAISPNDDRAVRLDELGFVVKHSLQLVIADPEQVQKNLEKYYPEDSESVTDILKELGADKDIAKEVSEVEATDDAAMMDRLANEAPIVRFVNLVVMQAVQDRASDIHFENLENWLNFVRQTL